MSRFDRRFGNFITNRINDHFQSESKTNLAFKVNLYEIDNKIGVLTKLLKSKLSDVAKEMLNNLSELNSEKTGVNSDNIYKLGLKHGIMLEMKLGINCKNEINKSVTDEICKLNQRIDYLVKALEDAFDEQDKTLFIDIQRLERKREDQELENNYKIGFKDGATLAIKLGLDIEEESEEEEDEPLVCASS